MANDGEMKGDKLVLRGLKFHGYHGVKDEEKKLGQIFVIDIDAWMDLRPAGISDCLVDTISYTDIYRIVKEVVEGTPQNLLETVAQLIASATLTKHSRISAVRVQVRNLMSQFQVILTSWVLRLPDTKVLTIQNKD